MITGPLFVHQMERGHIRLQFQLTVSDRLYSMKSRVHWRGITKPTQKQIRKMRKISFFIRQYRHNCGYRVFNGEDIDRAIDRIRLHKMGEQQWQ